MSQNWPKLIDIKAICIFFYFFLYYIGQINDYALLHKNMTNCKNCLIIRYFIIAVLVIILAALLFTDKMKYLSFINPEKISYLVIVLGTLVFLFKLYSYLKTK